MEEDWSEEQDRLLLKGVRCYLLPREGSVVQFSDADWIGIAAGIPGKIESECRERLSELHQECVLLATIDEVWKKKDTSSRLISVEAWGPCLTKICRGSAPCFDRRHLRKDPRAPREYVDASNAALLHDTVVGDSITTVNDTLIPADIFGKPTLAAHKAHLLPKAREDALTWMYVACAVLGLDMALVNTPYTEKAVLGCTEPTPLQKGKSTPKKYPGIRNFLSNIVRFSNPGTVFDKNPYVMIFPICDLDFARQWKGQGYDAIVLCENETVAARIGMNYVRLKRVNWATMKEINIAVGLASMVCELLAHSVLQKSEKEVTQYQDDAQKPEHERFRWEKKIAMPSFLAELPQKLVFKVSFVGHDMQDPGKRHPAPDPMLLAFKSCNNWCRKYAGFRMLASAKPEEDYLSEEGKQNLRDYLEWRTLEEKSRQHDEIMNLFGGQGSVSVS